MVSDADGARHTMRAEYVTVDAPRRLSWREVDSGLETEVTLTEVGPAQTEV